MECASMKNPECSTGPAVDPQPINPVVDFDALAWLLHRDRATLVADRCRAPDRLPPAYRVPGTRQPLWLLEEVLQWLRQHPEYEGKPPHVGRPPKAEQVRRQRRAGATQRNDQPVVVGRAQP
jgi:hypothetical protein